MPDGVLFGSSNAHRGLRKLLVEENQLEAVISMPAGVFKPYAGVSTAILIFTKGGKTERVWFYKMESDGFSLDDKRDKIGDGLGDLPDIRKQWFAREKAKKNDRKAKHFFVPVEGDRGEQVRPVDRPLPGDRVRGGAVRAAAGDHADGSARWTTRSGGTWMNWRRC